MGWIISIVIMTSCLYAHELEPGMWIAAGLFAIAGTISLKSFK